MWSQYDEKLSENPFFKNIQENHNDIIDKSSNENWIICIPRIGTFESADIPIDAILDHILVPGVEENFCTLSKKQVTVKGKHINTDSTDSSHLFTSTVEILFEETFYINLNAKYAVWCIDRPLFLKYNYCDSHSTRVLENLHDCIDFLWAESLGHAILDNIRELINNFIHQFEEIEIESLQTQKELVGKLFSQCLQMSLKNGVIRDKSMRNAQFLENLKISVETYMQYCLGRKLVFSVNTLQHQADSFLNKVIRNSSHLQFQHLGISNNLSDIITSAKCELSKINNYNTVLDKINCLKQTFTVIFRNKVETKNICITSDDILQILVFLVLRLNINNWMSNVIFMKEFRLSLLENSDQSSFFITSLEAALEFIKSNQFLDIKNNMENLLDASQLAMKCVCDRIKKGEIMSLVTKSENTLKKKLCHPLCSCKQCQNIINDESEAAVVFNPASCNEKGQNLLIVATLLGDCEAVEFLLNEGFSGNFLDGFGKSSMHYAARLGYQNILLLLINRNYNVNAVDNEKNTPLHLACANGHENCVKALIYSSGEVELNVGNFFGETPLHLATKWGYFEIVKILLENGASIIVKNRRNQTVLNLAPNLYIVKLFERFGLSESSKIEKEFGAISSVLMEEKNPSNECKDHGTHPINVEQFKKVDLLLKAIESNDLPLSCFYLGFSNNVAKRSEHGTCHPLCACEKCQDEQEFDLDSIERCQQSININMCNMNGYTPLHVASKFGRTEILRLLLDCGALPNLRTYKTLYTSLHLACIHQRIQIVRELLKCGNCEIDGQDAKGNTPLFYACTKNDVNIVGILLSNGADCNKKNYAGRSVLQESEENMQYRIFKLLKNSFVNRKDSNGLGTNNDIENLI